MGGRPVLRHHLVLPVPHVHTVHLVHLLQLVRLFHQIQLVQSIHHHHPDDRVHHEPVQCPTDHLLQYPHSVSTNHQVHSAPPNLCRNLPTNSQQKLRIMWNCVYQVSTGNRVFQIDCVSNQLSSITTYVSTPGRIRQAPQALSPLRSGFWDRGITHVVIHIILRSSRHHFNFNFIFTYKIPCKILPPSEYRVPISCFRLTFNQGGITCEQRWNLSTPSVPAAV